MQAPSRQHLAPTRSEKATTDGTTTLEGPSMLRALLSAGAVGDWMLDPTASTVLFTASMLGGLIPVRGGFRDLSGHFTVSAEGGVSGEVTIDAASVDTKNVRRDKHLRSASFFDVEHHPRIEFVATGIRPSPRGVAVTGSLTLLGRTRPFRLDGGGTLLDDADVALEGSVALDWREAGMPWNSFGMASTKVEVAVRAVFRRVQ